MILTITKSVQEMVEVSFPVYFRANENECYYMKDEVSGLRVFNYQNKFATINTEDNVGKENLSRLLSNCEFITDKEFGQSFIRASEIIADALPEVDGLKLHIHPAKLA